MMKKEKLTVYRCNSLKAAQRLFEKFSKMNIENLDREIFFLLYEKYEKGNSGVGFCVQFNYLHVFPLDKANLFDVNIVDI